MKKNKEQTSPFKAIETHFLNVFHSGIYISAQEMSQIGAKYDLEVPLKNRELIIKQLLNDANDEGKLTNVIADISSLVNQRIEKLQSLASNYPKSSGFLQQLIQKATSSNLYLQRQQKANPYE